MKDITTKKFPNKNKNMRIIIQMEDVEPKKHSVRFNSKDANAFVTSIYIKNEGLKKLGERAVDGVEITIRPINRK